MKILFIGDIFGAPGRFMVANHLKKIVSEYEIDVVIANAENAAHGKGITEKIYNQLISYGVDIITMGNHTWAKPEFSSVLSKKNVVRPYNLDKNFDYFQYGVGTIEFEINGLKLRVSNFLGNSVFLRNHGNQINSFQSMDDLLNTHHKSDVHIVDFHAETTAEKYAFLWAFNGKVDAIIGTHTHVPTNDVCITKEGTVFVCDVGMTGPSHGIIGAKKDDIIKKFFNPELKFSLEVQSGPKQFCSVIMEFDENNKKMINAYSFIIREGFSSLGKTIINNE